MSLMGVLWGVEIEGREGFFVELGSQGSYERKEDEVDLRGVFQREKEIPMT